MEMNFDLSSASEVLERTPATLFALLGGLGAEWTRSDENPENWKPYDVIGHLIHGEKTDWIPRARIILDGSNEGTFEPFDRLAQFQGPTGKSIDTLLAEFKELRSQSLETLRSWKLTPHQLEMRGIHPELGKVTLRELLATWVVHDLTHIRQIARSMAERYKEDVGVWREYLSILR